MQSRVNLHLYQGAFRHETRILKQTKSIYNAAIFDKIIVATFWEEGLPEVEIVDDYLEVQRVKTTIKFKPNKNSAVVKILLLLEWYFRVIYRFSKKNLVVITVHSLETLPLGAILKKRKKAKLIYDAHELETEKVGLGGSIQKIYKKLEKRYIYKADACFVVSESIADWYKNEYTNYKKIYTVKNVPYNNGEIAFGKSNVLKEKFSIPNDQLLFIYQGGLFGARFIENLLEIFSGIKNKHIVFMGYGNLEGLIKEYALKNNNIHLHPAVKQKDILHYTSSADIGLAVGENVCLSYYYSLPNKLFEYILSGLPIMACNWPEMKRMVEDFNCGWAVEPKIEDFKKAIEAISKEMVMEKKNNVQIAKNKFGWHLEEKILIEIYTQVLNK